MQVSFTAHAPNHSMLTIQQRLEAAGFTNVHVNAISDSTQPFTRTNPETIQATRKANNSCKHDTAASTPWKKPDTSTPTATATYELATPSRMPRPRPRTLVQRQPTRTSGGARRVPAMPGHRRVPPVRRP